LALQFQSIHETLDQISEMKALPEIGAAFVLEGGTPQFIRMPRVHYKIRLSIRNAPSDTYAVTYILDETFADPTREVRDPPDYPLEIFSYGDFTVRAEVRTQSTSYNTAGGLYAALRAESVSPSPAIAQALKDISEN